jgi:hypothetical protein
VVADEMPPFLEPRQNVAVFLGMMAHHEKRRRDLSLKEITS